MRTALATFPRQPGERRIEVDLDARKAFISFYVPQLKRPPRIEMETRISEGELDATIEALIEARAQLRASRGGT